MQKETQRHNDKGRVKTSLTKYISLNLFARFEKGYSRFYCERELETEQNCYILTPTLMAVSVVSFSFSRAAQPEAHSAGWWLSLLHLFSNFSGPQLNQGPRAPSAWRGFPYYISSVTPTPTLTVWLLFWLSYIIVQRPLRRLLNLWNRMFDRHQTEITVMQLTGHSLPVHQSMNVPWEFFYLVPFHQPISAHAISSYNCH